MPTQTETDAPPAMEELIALASQIVNRGYDEPVAYLALRRKGVSSQEARLVAASVARCHAALRAAQVAQSVHAPADPVPVRRIPLAPQSEADLRAARAASHALSRMASFFMFIIVGLCGGALLGWSIGFGQGMDQGFDWMVTALEHLLER